MFFIFIDYKLIDNIYKNYTNNDIPNHVNNLVVGNGFEPLLRAPKTPVLPLDDPTIIT